MSKNHKGYGVIGSMMLLAICLIYLATPGIIFNELYDAITTSNFICFSALIAVAGMLFLLGLVLAKEKVMEINLIDLGLLCLIVYLIVNRYFLHKTQPFSLFFQELILSAFLYVMLRIIDEKNIFYIFLAAVVGSFLQTITGFMQFFGLVEAHNQYFKITGSFFNPGPFGCYLASITPIIVGLYLQPVSEMPSFFQKLNGSMLKKLMLPIGIASALMLSLVNSRAALLAAIAGAAVLTRGGLYRRMAGQRSIQWTLILTSIVLLSVLYFTKKDSADGRFLIWKISKTYIVNHPVTGSGYGLFQTNYMKAQANYFMSHGSAHEKFISDNVYYAYNEFLEFFFENGVLGILIMIVLIIVLYKVKGNTVVFKIGIAGLIVYTVIGLFSYPSQVVPLRMMCVLYLACIARYGRCVFSFDLCRSRTYAKSGVILILAAVITITTFNTISLYDVFKKWRTADLIVHSGNYETAKQHYDALYPALANNGTFLFEYANIYAALANLKKSIEVASVAKKYIDHAPLRTDLGNCYFALKNSDSATACYNMAIHMCPYKIYPKYKLLQLCMSTGQKQQARTLIKDIVSNKLKAQSSASDDILLYVKSIADTMKTQ